MIFDLPTDHTSFPIKVIGVGGAGSNAVTHMFKKGIKGVEFIICNTDKQALEKSPVPNKIQLGVTLTKGRGAGSIPEVGKNSAIESIEDVKVMLGENTEMLFITAGMGGGTGTGAAPIIAQAARELGILTVAIVTFPFAYEGSKRKTYAEKGLEELKHYVDSLLVIKNDKLRELFTNLPLSQVFAHADDVLGTAAKSISEIIIGELHINIDMNDVNTVMRDSGVAIMGSALAQGEGRAIKAVQEALSSPLLNDNNIVGARHVLLNVVSGTEELTIDEMGEIVDYVQEEAGQTAEIISGFGIDESLEGNVKVTIIATGFNQSNEINFDGSKKAPEKVVLNLSEPQATIPTIVAEQPKVETPVSQVSSTATINTTVEVKNDLNSLEPVLKSSITNTVSSSSKDEEKVNNTIDFEVKKVEFNEPVLKSELPQTEPAQPQATLFSDNNDTNNTVKYDDTISPDKQKANINERILKLRQLSFKIQSAQGLHEMENEPAYKRRNVQLENTPSSSESQVSRFTLSESQDNKTELRQNNSFLHDNVD